MMESKSDNFYFTYANFRIDALGTLGIAHGGTRYIRSHGVLVWCI